MSSTSIPEIPVPKVPGGGIPDLEEDIRRRLPAEAEAVAQEGQTNEEPAQTEEEKKEEEVVRESIKEALDTQLEVKRDETKFHRREALKGIEDVSVKDFDGNTVKGKEIIARYTNADGKLDEGRLLSLFNLNKEKLTPEVKASVQKWGASKKEEDQFQTARDAAEDKEKWSLKDLAYIFTAAAAGVNIWETIERLNAEDDPALDYREELRKAVEANTDKYTRELILNAAYGDQSALADLENITRYGNQFGSLASDMFNDEQFGEFFEQDYQTFLKELGEQVHPEGHPQAGQPIYDPDEYDRDRYLREFARDNPTHEAAQLINESISRLGQLKRSSNELAELDRSLMRSGYEDAAKFYKPSEEGGWGFEPDDFRTGEQKTLLDYAMGLTEDTYERYQQGGELEPDTLRKLSADALTSVDPALQAQQYFGGGGIAKSVLNTSEAKRKRMFEDEAAFASALGATSKMTSGMTVDASQALGLTGPGGWNAASGQLETGAQGFDYGSTDFYSGILANNMGIAQANAAKDPASTGYMDIAESLKTLQETVDQLTNKG